MALVGGAFSETLYSITTTKLEELSKNRTAFEQEYNALQGAANAEAHQLKRLIILTDGVKKCLQVRTNATKIKGPDGTERLGHVDSPGTNIPGLEIDLKILDRFLEQARFDPSVLAQRLAEWEQILGQYLSRQNVKYTYASLYGELVNEWLASEQKPVKSSSENIEMTDAPQDVPGGKRLDSRRAWEESVFTPRVTDQAAIERYLNKLFGGVSGEDSSDLRNALANLRKEMQVFGSNLTSPNQFSSSTLRWVIKGLQASDLLSNEKRDVLKDFAANEIILSEIADVLNMRMAALDNWSWGSQVSAQQRRKLNGTYAIHLDEDLLQAIFLQFIGVKWSVLFKEALRAFCKHKNVWKKLSTPMSRTDKNRREYYLGPQNAKSSLNSHRFSVWRKNYFLFQLPDDEFQHLEFDDGEEEAEPEPVLTGRTKQTARHGAQAPRRVLASKACRKLPPSPKRRRILHTEAEESDSEEEDDVPDVPRRPMDAKQRLLHLLATEIAINTHIHGEASCFRSAFEDWNSLLPHSTILAVLGFFGVPNNWLSFFLRFLQAPLKLDDDQAEPRTRKCGTPGAHSLSDIFGEAILFCLDFAVNQCTNGSLLHRINDDFWFWSGDHGKSVRAWQAAEHFTKVMGVNLNATKTGSSRISADRKEELSAAPLPEGEIRWGFLYLDPLTGRFEIDELMIQLHVKELEQQLRAKDKSIFSWIQAWNTYATTFFAANFGKAANCFGRVHLDRILAAHQHINLSLFPDDGSITEYLKRLIKDRFGVEGVPDGFLFFPVELGGLGLQNPFIGPLLIRDAVLQNPLDLLQKFEQTEREGYRVAKVRFEKGEIDEERYAVDDPGWKPLEGKDEFMSFAEFIKYREDLDYEFVDQLTDVFSKLLFTPREEAVDATADVLNAIASLKSQTNLKGITSSWYDVEPYWKWVAQMYGPEMISKFGGLNIVEPGLLPVGMVSFFQGKRVIWQG